MNPKIKSALIRFFRVMVPQIPAIIAYVTVQKPEWAALFSLLGSMVTAIDKYMRDEGYYNNVPFA